PPRSTLFPYTTLFRSIRAAHQRLREVEAHAPAARERRHWLCQLVRLEAETEQQRLGARPRGIDIGVAELAVQLGDQRAVIGGFRAPQFFLHRAQCTIAVDRVLDRRSLERRGFLRHMRDAPVRGHLDVAFVRVQLAAQHREEARLARAVGADETDALAGVEGEVGTLEERLGAAPESDLRETDHAEKAAILLRITAC